MTEKTSTEKTLTDVVREKYGQAAKHVLSG